MIPCPLENDIPIATLVLYFPTIYPSYYFPIYSSCSLERCAPLHT